MPINFSENIMDKQRKKYTIMDDKSIIYVKRWFRSKHAVIFRMNNKTVQVIFVDQT